MKTVILLIIGFVIGILVSDMTGTSNVDVPVVYDTIYNTTILDSLAYDIEYRDSIIYELHKKIIYDKDTIMGYDDSTTISTFFEFVGSDCE